MQSPVKRLRAARKTIQNPADETVIEIFSSPEPMKIVKPSKGKRKLLNMESKPIKRGRTATIQLPPPNDDIKQEKATGSHDIFNSLKQEVESDEDEIPAKKQRKVKSKIGIKQEKATASNDIFDSLKQEVESEENEIPVKKQRKTKPKIKAEDAEHTKKTKVKKESEDSQTSICPLWEDFEIIQYNHGLEEYLARNVVKLFSENNTVPFIARYRKAETGNMSADDLRHVKETIEKTHALKSRMQSIFKILEKNGKLTDNLRHSLLSARNLEILEHLYSPYKQGAPHSLAERAKLLGLEEPAINILENKIKEELVGYTKDGELSIADVEKGIGHIMAHIIATDTDMLKFLHDLKKHTNFSLEAKKARKRAAADNKIKKEHKDVDESKYSLYFDYKICIKYLKPHQILAINRGEHQKILSVKILVPDFFKNKFTSFCVSKWIRRNNNYSINNTKLINDAIQDAYSRIITPLVTREIRTELKAKAETASVEVFSGNLKQLLLAAPIKGRKILGIDPGFSHGCKLALISETGSVIATNVVYLLKGGQDKGKFIIEDLLKSHDCSLIALGNGTACRETETWIADMIAQNVFKPLDVTYTIVSENGASVYSCGDEAKKEFPAMDPNLISAVSLARRIQEPLAELVKVEPKHLGVGMYQHDLSPKRLEEALNDVVSECVSFVGVDLNTASQCLLKHVAGLTDKRASEIIKYRETNGPFTSREQLKNVKGIGANSFQQCAGFLKITGLLEDNEDHKNINKLDYTIIHPEAYSTTFDIIKHSKLKIEDLGEKDFITAIKKEESNLTDLHEKFDTTKETLALILETLSKPLSYDLRDDLHNKPLFKSNLTSINDLEIGCVLTGRIENCTHFGCFVDIGVKFNGLIHTSKMKNTSLKIGDRVEVRVVNLEVERKRIQLELIKVI